MVLYAKDIVETDFISLEGEVDAFEAAKLMKERRRGFVVITSSAGAPIGIVTEWDYISRLAAEGKDPKNAMLREIMSTNMISVDANLGIEQVSQLMTQRRIRRVLVLRDGKVVGVITSKTLLSKLKAYVDTVSTQVARLQGPWQ